MTNRKEEFIRLALHCKALKFGSFILKSGRPSPYFFNAGSFYEGDALRQLGNLYADVLIEHKIDFDHLFGPAYKGLPLATATAIALSTLGINTSVTFNRKEIKDHGEGGQIMGSPLSGRTLIIDDVITAGTAFREAQTQIAQHGGKLIGIITALDRCERGLGEKTTATEISSQDLIVHSIIDVLDLIEYLEHNKQPIEAERLKQHLRQYGAN